MTAAIDVLLGLDLTEAGVQAAALDGAGVDGMFTYEGSSDVFFPLVRAAEQTRGMLYTNIAVALPRSPLHLATAAWDLQRLSGGRFALGLGSQIRAHIERRYGATWDQPVAQMRETIEAVKAIFAAWQHQQPLDFTGRWTTHTLMPPNLTPSPLESGPPPVWAAALGPDMTAMAGAVADGLLVHPFTTRHHVETHTLANLDRGLARTDRDRSELTLVVGAIVGIHDGTDQARASAEAVVRGTLGFYGSTPAYRPVLDTHGWGDLQPELRRLTKENRWAELGGLYDEEQVDALAFLGTPSEVGTALAKRWAGVADRLALSLPQGIQPDALGELLDAYRSVSD